MSVREPIVVPDGFRLVKNGLGPETLRDPTVVRHWGGLSADDAALLYRFVRSRGDDLEELHTDVPCGMVLEVDSGPVGGYLARYVDKCSPLRIDACALVRGKWWVLEVKPDAGYMALGQVLVYLWYACRTNDALVAARAAVVTDKVQACIAPIFEELGVTVFEVGPEPGGSGA